MSIQIKIRTMRNARKLCGKDAYVAQVLPDGGFRFAHVESRTAEAELFRLVVFPGEILDCRICVKGQVPGQVRSGQFQAVVVSPNPASPCPDERLGLVRFSSVFWEEFEPFFSSDWRITRCFWIGEESHSSPLDEMPAHLRDLAGRKGRYFLAENGPSQRLFFDAESVASMDWVAHHIEIRESKQEATDYTKRLMAELRTAHLSDSRRPSLEGMLAA